MLVDHSSDFHLVGAIFKHKPFLHKVGLGCTGIRQIPNPFFGFGTPFVPRLIHIFLHFGARGGQDIHANDFRGGRAGPFRHFDRLIHPIIIHGLQCIRKRDFHIHHGFPRQFVRIATVIF